MRVGFLHWLRHVAAASSVLGILALVGCARSDGPPEPSEGQATIGAGGGVVQGPDGVTVEVPAGALASDVTLRVARDGTGAPPPPTGFEAFGSTYQFTPHGRLFEVPATVSLPVNVAALPADAAPLFFHAQPGDQWIQIVDAQLDGNRLVAPTLSFSYGHVLIGYVDPAVPPAQRRSIKEFALIAPSGLPLANGWLPTVNQPTTVTIRVVVDSGFVNRRCAVSPTIELARAIKTVTDNIPPVSWFYQPVGNQQFGPGSYQLDFNVPLDHNHNGTNWFIAKFDCPLRPGGPFVEERRWFLFGYVRVKVQVPVPPGAPSITQHPQSITVAEGASASINVVASAPDTLVVQWQRSNDGGATWNTVASGVNLTSYTLNPVQSSDHGARFRANVCNQLGMQLNCITSNVATLTVTPATTPPVFTQQPQSISVVEGQTASFTVAATGTPTPTVRWYRALAGGPVQVGPTCSGSGGTTACTYTTPAVTAADNGARFYALADNGQQTRSDTATLTVTSAATPPAIPANEPADVTVAAGQNATFNVNATGTAPLSYQWQRNGADIAGANGASYTLNNAQMSDNGARLRVIVSNGAGSATSREATLTVTAPGACAAPQLIESGAGHAGLPQIAMDANGNAVAVWQQNDGTFTSIYANRFAAGSGWGSAQLIENLVGDLYQPRIAMDSGGNAIAVWSSQYDRIYANRYVAGGGWGTAQRLDSMSGGNPDIVMDPSGSAIVVWQGSDINGSGIYARFFSTGSGWSAPQLIGTRNGADSVNNARIVVDGNGNAIAVWSQSNGTSYNLTANRYTQGIGWGTAQPIETLSREADEADIAMNASGDAVVVWRDRTLDGNGNLVDAPVYAVRYTPGSGWGTVQRLDSGTNYGYVLDVPRVAIDAQGNAIAVWHDYDGAGQRIYARRYVAGSGWGALEQLQSPTGNDAWRPDVAMDANGNAIAVWMQSHVPTFGIFVNRYTPGSGWGGATLVANATIDVYQLRVALNGGGTAIAVWQEGDGTTYNVKAVRCP